MRNPNAKCSICNKSFYRRPSEFKEGKEFCCRGCRSELYKRKPSIWRINFIKGYGWNKGMSKKNGDALSYGKPRSLKTKQLISKALKGHKKTKEHRRNIRIAFVKRRGKMMKKGTLIEKILEEWLINNNISFKKQKPIEEITNPDFFIEPNICLYADGDYWHNLENVKERDKRINNQLKSNGYIVIRLLGSEIKKGVRPIELL